MIKVLYSLFAIKMVKTFYYRKLIKTSGNITIQDILLDLFVSFMLFYSINVFIDKDIDKTAFTYFTFDSLAVVALLLSYIYYVKKQNTKSYIESFEENKNAKKELENMRTNGRLDNVNVKFRPYGSYVQFIDINIVQLLCIIPYFIVIYE
jgi:hypothetical protein